MFDSTVCSSSSLSGVIVHLFLYSKSLLVLFAVCERAVLKEYTYIICCIQMNVKENNITCRQRWTSCLNSNKDLSRKSVSLAAIHCILTNKYSPRARFIVFTSSLNLIRLRMWHINVLKTNFIFKRNITDERHIYVTI